MKTYFVAVIALMLYCTAHAETMESSVKDSSVHEETTVTKDGDDKYTTTIYQSSDSANAMQSTEDTYHEADSSEAFYKEVVVGTDGYHSAFEEKYNTESDVLKGDNLYTSHYMEGYMRDESEHNPEMKRDTAEYESNKYIENVSDTDGTYKEDVYGESVYKSSFDEPGYHETVEARDVYDSDVTKSHDYYESNLDKSSMYDESVNEGGYESAYYESTAYKEHVAESGNEYEESIYGESVVKTSESEHGNSTATYDEVTHESDLYKDNHTWESNLYKSDSDVEIVASDDDESNVADMNTYEENVAQNF